MCTLFHIAFDNGALDEASDKINGCLLAVAPLITANGPDKWDLLEVHELLMKTLTQC